MAISLKAAGAWARIVATGSVTIPGTPAAGDRMFLFASWKDFAITASVSGWTAIGTEFADGTTNAGNGTGSVKVMAWYRDWQTGDGNPTLTYSSGPTEGHAVIMLWQKAAGESWNTPLTVTAAMTNWTTTSQTVAASSTVAVPSGGVVMGLIGIRDDSATMTRPTTGIDDSTGAITWNGNYVESPATHFNSTTGLDMSGDLGHRFVTTGATATLQMTGTIAAAETGAAKWVVQGVFTPNPQTATPTTLALTLATFAPTIRLNKIATPSTLALTLTKFAPTVRTPRLVTPATRSQSLATFAPTVSTPRLATPSTLALTLSTFAPNVQATANVQVTPATVSLTSASFAPAVSTPRLVTPTTTGLTLSTFAPVITSPRLVTPATVAISVSAFAPTVSAPRLATPSPISFTLATFAPSVASPRVVTPATRSLVLNTFAPDVAVSDGSNITVVPSTAGLSLSAFAPTVVIPRTVIPSTTSLTLATFAPVIVRPVTVTPATVAASVVTFAPDVSVGGDRVITPGTVTLTLTAYAPSVTASIVLEPDFEVSLSAQNFTAETVIQNTTAVVPPEPRTRRTQA